MKAVDQINDTLIDNKNCFQDPFFKRFHLRHAQKPLQLTNDVSKNYLFPTFYNNVTCAIGIFLCSYEKAQELVSQSLGPQVKPVKMTRNRSLVIFSCYEYKQVMNVNPYNEVAMTIPVLVNPGIQIPVLPMLLDKLFSGFGYFVFGMPVTSRENQIRGNKLWGLPKVTQDIDIFEENRDCVTIVKEPSDEPYFKLRVPMDGRKTDFDVTSNLYSRLQGSLLQSETNFKATFSVTKYMNLLLTKNKHPNRSYLELGDTPSADKLKNLEIEKHPFQFRYAKGMTSCFDLPNPEYQSGITLT